MSEQVDVSQPFKFTAPDGTTQVRGGGLVRGSLPVFNDTSNVVYAAGTALVLGVNSPRMEARVISGADNITRNLREFVPRADLLDEFAPETTFIGVVMNDIPPGHFGEVAGPGSVVVVRCKDASADPLLKITGAWVGASDEPGAVRGLTYSQVIGTTYQGKVVGRIIAPAGPILAGVGGDIYTGSNLYVGVIILPR